jgi:aminoglycoside phosphotransferase (APT) family kinase protein
MPPVVDAWIQERLEAWAADELGHSGARVEDLRRTSAGFSRENWNFDLVDGAQRRPLIARRDPVGSVLDTDRSVETAILRALEATDVPAPRVVWSDADGERLGRPTLVMERATGDCDWFVLNGERALDVRLDLAHQLCDRLADIHLVDWRAVGLGDVLEDPGPGTRAAHRAIDHWEAELRRVELEPQPELEVVLAWLRAHAPTAPATTLVHADFKPGNVLLTGDEVTLVLDWETAHLGDPQEDLGWVTNPVRAGEHRIEGAWTPTDLLDRWSARTGLAYEPVAVRWWNVLANLKLCVIVLTGTRAFVEGRYDRLHQAPLALSRVLLDLIGA